MIDSIKKTRDELYSELEYIFEMLTENNEDVSIRHTSTDQSLKYNKSKKGMLVLKSDNQNKLKYAMRMNYYTTKNQKEKIYWYNEEGGWSDMRRILNEKNDILDLLWQFSSRDSNIINDEDYEFIEELFEDLELKIDHYRKSQDLDDIADKIKNHNTSYLQNIISTNKKESLLFWKLMHSKNKDKIDNPVSIEYQSDKYLLVKSDRIYKNNGDIKKYPCGVIIGSNECNDGFFILRLPRCERLNSEDYKWSKDDIIDKLGYDRDITDETDYHIQDNIRYRIHTGLILNKKDYDNKRSEYQKWMKNKIQEDVFTLYADLYSELFDVDLNGIHQPVISKTGSFSINSGLTTEQLKTIQDQLDIPEETVRKIQRYRDIGRLSSNLRSDIISTLIYDKILNRIMNTDSSTLYDYQEEFQQDTFSKFSTYSPKIPNSREGKSRDYIMDILIDNVEELSYNKMRRISEIASEEFFNNTRNEINFGLDTNGNHKKITIENSKSLSVNHRLDDLSYDENRIKTIIVSKNNSELTIRRSGEIEKCINIDKGFYELRKFEQMYPSKFN